MRCHRSIILLALNALLASAASACECLWEGPFVRAAERAQLIVSGAVIETKGNAFDLRVEKILRGKEYRDTVRIWASDGKLCRPEVDQFAPGTQWLLALHYIDKEVEGGFNPLTPNISYGRVDDYYLSKCGAYWLRVQEGRASGNLLSGARWQWDDPQMNPVIVEVIGAYFEGVIPLQALESAAQPSPETKRLMLETRAFTREQVE